MKKTGGISLVLVLVLACVMTSYALAAVDINTYTPYELTVREIPQDGTHPYGSVLLTFRINALPRSSENDRWQVSIEKKIGDGSWDGVNDISSDDCLDLYQTNAGVFTFEQLYVETTEWDGTQQISYRLYVKQYDNTWWGVGQSGYSNVAAIGLSGSAWALPELKKAGELGLIPSMLNGADMIKPITREEFAVLAVLLYEKTVGKAATPVEPNPFSDTTNPEILKAYTLGITGGTTLTTFEPNLLINREQCATMLFRAIKAIAPTADYTVNGVPDFPDQKDIGTWAVDGTKYMSKLGIIKGDANGNFMPKATTTAQEAVGYGTATREAAILMAVRSYVMLTA